jgi:hypothetical protein
VLTWDNSAGVWYPALPQGGYLPGGSPPPGGYTPAIFYRASDASLAVDDDLTWVAGTNTLTTINVTGSGVVKGTNTYGARFATEAATNRALANATGVTVERYFTCTAEGNGESFNIQSNTPSAGNKIVRKIWYKNEAFEDTDVNTWTLLHTFADDTAYASTATKWQEYLDGQANGTPPFTLAISWEDVPAVTGILDGYTSGVGLAYATAWLNPSYTGSAIRVRRASDNTEQDIGFDGQDLDTSALTTFCTGTNGFIRTWYDQSGNGNDLIQTTTASQPKIYDSSTGVVKDNLLPATTFAGSELITTNELNQTSATNHIYIVNRVQAGTDGNGYFVESNAIDGDQSPAIAQLNAGHDYYLRQSASNTFMGSFSSIKGTQAIFTCQISNSTSKLFFQGSEICSVSTTTVTAFADKLIVGRYINANPASFEGTFQAFILYNSDQSANRAAIESALNDYFNVY